MTETPTEEPVSVQAYINNSINSFVAAREKYRGATKETAKREFEIASLEALVAITQSLSLIVTDLHSQVRTLVEQHTSE
jgi:hypothetical protein